MQDNVTALQRKIVLNCYCLETSPINILLGSNYVVYFNVIVPLDIKIPWCFTKFIKAQLKIKHPFDQNLNMKAKYDKGCNTVWLCLKEK